MPFRPVSAAAACLALWLLPGAGRAQNAAPALLPPSASAAPVPPIVDPAARDLFMQMVAAQQQVRSFVLAVDTQDKSAGKVVPESQGHLRIAFAAPARASVTLTRDGKILGRVISSGTVLSRVDMRHQSYRQDVLPAAAAAGIVSGEIGNLGVLPHAFVDPNGLGSLLSAPGLVAVARGPASAEPVGGAAVDSVVARLVGGDGQFVYTFVIGQSDHLLRRVMVEETASASKSSPARSLTHTETVTELSADPPLPASTFAFKPLAGFKKVTGAR